MTHRFDEDCSLIADFAKDRMHFMLRENGELYDVTDSPFSEKPILDGGAGTAEARKRLQAVLDRLHPAALPAAKAATSTAGGE